MWMWVEKLTSRYVPGDTCKAHKESVCVQWYRDVSVSGTELSWSGPCSRGSNVTPWRRHQSSTDGHPRSSESLTPELGEGRRRRTAAFCCGANYFFSPRLSAFVAEVTRSRFKWERIFLYSFKGVFSVFFPCQLATRNSMGTKRFEYND